MSFIDWSDPEAMFGLLVEYVADETCRAKEPMRRALLLRLREELEELLEHFQALPLVEAIDALRAIRRSIGDEFENDPVLEHLSACIEELERVHESAA
jgi:hypothetical protein